MILDKDFDVELLMLYLERSIDPSKLKGNGTIIKYRFSDLTAQRDWWLVVEDGKTEICLKDPGRDVNVYFDCSVRTMCDVWMGDRTYREAIQAGDLSVQGDPVLTRNIRSWLRPSIFDGSKRAPVTETQRAGKAIQMATFGHETHEGNSGKA